MRIDDLRLDLRFVVIVATAASGRSFDLFRRDDHERQVPSEPAFGHADVSQSCADYGMVQRFSRSDSEWKWR